MAYGDASMPGDISSGGRPTVETGSFMPFPPAGSNLWSVQQTTSISSREGMPVMWKILSVAVVLIGFLSFISCGRDEYLSPGREELQYSEWVVKTYHNTPSAADCHVKVVREYMDELEALHREAQEILYRFENLIFELDERPEFAYDQSWRADIDDAVDAVDESTQRLRNMDVPIPMFRVHQNIETQRLHEVAAWYGVRAFIETGKFDHSYLEAADDLVTKPVYADRTKEAWASYYYTCGDVYGEESRL